MKTTLKHFCSNKEVSKEKGKSLTLNKEVLLYFKNRLLQISTEKMKQVMLLNWYGSSTIYYC